MSQTEKSPLRALNNLAIAKQKYEIGTEIEQKVSHQTFVTCVERHSDYLVWNEDTERGKEQIAGFRIDLGEDYQNILFSKHLALAEYMPRKDNWGVSVKYSSVG